MQKIIRQRGTGPRATSCRNTGRHHLGTPGRLRRNPHEPIHFAIGPALVHWVRRSGSIIFVVGLDWHLASSFGQFREQTSPNVGWKLFTAQRRVRYGRSPCVQKLSHQLLGIGKDRQRVGPAFGKLDGAVRRSRLSQALRSSRPCDRSSTLWQARLGPAIPLLRLHSCPPAGFLYSLEGKSTGFGGDVGSTDTRPNNAAPLRVVDAHQSLQKSLNRSGASSV